MLEPTLFSFLSPRMRVHMPRPPRRYPRTASTDAHVPAHGENHRIGFGDGKSPLSLLRRLGDVALQLTLRLPDDIHIPFLRVTHTVVLLELSSLVL